MTKIKMTRSSPSLDMTPMVDLAFLLVTFFMLTATMRAPEPVLVDTPKSISDLILPKNTMLITIDTGGRVFYNVEGKEVRINTLRRMMNKFPEVKCTDAQVEKFGAMQSFGCSFADLPEFIDADQNHRDAINKATKGIPIDTVGQKDQLSFWINFGRVEAATWVTGQRADGKTVEDQRIAIKADGKAAYKKVDAVIALFKKQEVFRFNLITALE